MELGGRGRWLLVVLGVMGLGNFLGGTGDSWPLRGLGIVRKSMLSLRGRKDRGV